MRLDYCVVAVDAMAQHWRSIQSGTGVRRLICNGDHAERVLNRVMSGLHAVASTGAIAPADLDGVHDSLLRAPGHDRLGASCDFACKVQTVRDGQAVAVA
jgi:hypothetical protein